jgi:hypothetical protein
VDWDKSDRAVLSLVYSYCFYLLSFCYTYCLYLVDCLLLVFLDFVELNIFPSNLLLLSFNFLILPF